MPHCVLRMTTNTKGLQFASESENAAAAECIKFECTHDISRRIACFSYNKLNGPDK